MSRSDPDRVATAGLIGMAINRVHRRVDPHQAAGELAERAAGRLDLLAAAATHWRGRAAGSGEDPAACNAAAALLDAAGHPAELDVS
ncbi:hypothetical protein [Longispora fulva]|uniref:Uncharacterized protein n=1 Tax=Longispora fulva TaxID=619741 RepID=A0A8J7GKE7_9ACTN|nr:hypothetical protein [Longispora fulva]MBG6134534.1 hypothetical protein [Longispora fulva]